MKRSVIKMSGKRKYISPMTIVSEVDLQPLLQMSKLPIEGDGREDAGSAMSGSEDSQWNIWDD